MSSFSKGRGLLLTLLGGAGLAGLARADEIFVTGPVDGLPHAWSSPWTADNTYNLQGQVYVTPGATLEIEAGTLIASTTDIGGSLAVAKGARIYIKGTQTNPVIFTSTRDVGTWIAGDPKTGTWAEESNEWGNLTVMGDAYVSENATAGNTAVPSASNYAQMEGLTAEFVGDTKQRYGGGNDDDDSGVIKFASFRYGGKVIALTNELNGLSLGGIGRETDIHHVEVMNNVDDGIEVWGGTVNLKYFSIWNVGDDSLDIDQGWRGKAQFGLVVQGYSANAVQGSGVGDNCFETDGAEQSNYQPVTTATIYNCTVIGQPVDGDHGTAWRDNARVQYRNCIFMDLGEQLVKNDNVDGDGGAGYGFGIPATLDWPTTWTTAYNAVPAHPNDFTTGSYATNYRAQSSGKLAEITDSVFFRNQFGTAYADATPVAAYPPSGANKNVEIPGILAADAPIAFLDRFDPVVKGGKTMVQVELLDPRPANEALDADAMAQADGFFTPADYRGAFAPGETWLADWTASYAFGFTPDDSPWSNEGCELEGTHEFPELVGAGPLTPSSLNTLSLVSAAPSALSALFVGLVNNPSPFKGGMLITVPIFLNVSLPTNASGAITLPFLWPTGIPAGFDIYYQIATQDTNAIKNVSLSNGLRGEAQ